MALPTEYKIGEVYNGTFANMLAYTTPKWVYLAGGGLTHNNLATHNFVVLDAKARAVTQYAQSLATDQDFAKAKSTFTEIDGPLQCMAVLGKVGKKNDWTTVCAPNNEALGNFLNAQYGIGMADFNSAVNDPDKYAEGMEGQQWFNKYDVKAGAFAIPTKGDDSAEFRQSWPTSKAQMSRFPF
jgi:hypothetical protein